MLDRHTQLKLAQLINSKDIASLGTIHEDEPLVTMVMYANSNDFSEFYLHLSTLALHTRNLQLNTHVSLLINESEEKDRNPQTLARVSISGTAEIISMENKNYEKVRKIYLKKYPSSGFNFQLNDFSMYKIVPRSARYIAGFGEIFNLSLDDFKNAARLI